jgi:uncharacterized UPF0160 family protein
MAAVGSDESSLIKAADHVAATIENTKKNIIPMKKLVTWQQTIFDCEQETPQPQLQQDRQPQQTASTIFKKTQTLQLRSLLRSRPKRKPSRECLQLLTLLTLLLYLLLAFVLL